jgi:hypothetical protein
MKYRKLRIAWSVAWGVAAVLVLVLRMRKLVRSGDAVFLLPPTERPDDY